MEYIKLYVCNPIQTELLVCRVCLSKNVKLYRLQDKLAEYYEELTRTNVSCGDGLPQYVCALCAALLRRAADVCARARHTYDILIGYIAEHGKLTTENLPQVDIKLTNRFVISNIESWNLTGTDDLIENPNNIFEPIYQVNEKDVELDANESLENEYKEEYIDSPALSETTEYETITEPIYHESDKEIEFNSNELPKSVTDNEIRKKRKYTLKENYNTKRKRKNPKPKGFQKKSVEDFAEFAKEHDCELLYLLTKEQKIAAMESKKESERYINAEYKCELCCSGFTTENTFKKHQKFHDPKTGPYKCEVCHKRYPKAKTLGGHRLTHLREFTCKRCGVVTYSTYLAKFHYQTHLAVQYTCKFCGKTFDRVKSRFEHVRIHHGSTPCPLCYEKFVHSGLRHHMHMLHRETFKCESCSMVFATEEARETHQNAAPDGRCGEYKPCACCGEPFLSEEDLEAHIATAHTRKPRKFLRKYKSKNNRNSQIKRKCSCEGDGECTCGAPPRKSWRKTMFMCEICGARFLQSFSALKIHQRIHTGEKPFQCPSCPKKFRIKYCLEIHERTHTGVRPFKCAQCGKAFKIWTALFRHKRNVHTNVRRFRCHICEKLFQTKSGVQLHVNSVHLKIPNKPRIRKRKPRPSPPVPESED